MNQFILTGHVVFGVAAILAAVWVFVDALHASALNARRIRVVAWCSAAFMWFSFLIGGYWYVTFYHVDKAIILKGPWPFAHEILMETKEHIVILMLLLATCLPIVAMDNLAGSKAVRAMLLWVSAITVVVGLGIEGLGSLISLGVKVALLML